MNAPLDQISKMEQGIVQLLKDGGLSASFFIDVFPDDPAQFDMANMTHVALVHYSGSRYAPPEAAQDGQDRVSTFAIHISLRASAGAGRGAAHVEAIRRAVQGRKVQGAKIYLIRDGLTDEVDGVWKYLIEIGCATKAVAQPTHSPRPLVANYRKEPQ